MYGEMIFIGQDLAYTNEQWNAICAENHWQEINFTKVKRIDDIHKKKYFYEKLRNDLIKI